MGIPPLDRAKVTGSVRRPRNFAYFAVPNFKTGHIESPSSTTRRRFLRNAAASTLIAPASALGLSESSAPSERINIGIIGLGGNGTGHLNAYLQMPDVQVVALCDVDRIHYREKPWGEGKAMGREPSVEKVKKAYAKRTDFKGVAAYTDYRELIARDDIDAVVISVPDHWHALCTLEALRAGKDVYCEKPVTHFFTEGQAVYREVAKQKAIFQVGSQQRSTVYFRRAVEVVMNGLLGKVREVQVGLPTGYEEPKGDPTIKDPPEGLDYNLWCGPAFILPYMRARHHRWWRGHTNFGGGALMDFIGHDNDIAHWALGFDKSGPEKVETVAWTPNPNAIYDTPLHFDVRCEYAGGIVSSISDRHTGGLKIIGEDGWVYANRGKIDASNREWIREKTDRGPVKAYFSNDHRRNFLDCIRTRKPCIAPAETGHRSITPGHLGYVSAKLKRPLKWDAKNEKVMDDPEADKLLKSMSHRKPWTFEI